MSDPKERLVDELLVLRCQEGHRPSFARLVERWQARLVRHARGLVWRDDAALDIVQETWLVVAKGLGKLRDPSRLRSWLYGIVTRRAADWQRGRARLEGLELESEPESRSAPAPMSSGDPGDDATADVERVRVALRHLPLERRALLALRYVDELDLSEIAEALDVPLGTVKSRLYTARRELRALLERNER